MKVATAMLAFALVGASCTNAIASTRDFPIGEFGAKPDGSRCTEAFADDSFMRSGPCLSPAGDSTLEGR